MRTRVTSKWELEALEPRRFLTGSFETTFIEWDGQRVEVAAGSWIVALERPAATFDEDGNFVRDNVPINFSDQPAPALTAALAQLTPLGIQFRRYLGG